MLRHCTHTATKLARQVLVRTESRMKYLCSADRSQTPNFIATAFTRVRHRVAGLTVCGHESSAWSHQSLASYIYRLCLSVLQANRRFGPGVPLASSQCFSIRAVARSAEPEPARAKSAIYNVQYDIYKGRSAIQFKPIMPTYRQAADGNLELSRRGCMLLELANSNGKRSYAWSEKITFAMSITELSQLFLTNAVLSGQVVDLFHDPGMGSTTQGQVHSHHRHSCGWYA